MKTYIEDDVLFTQKELIDLSFFKLDNLIEIWDDGEYIGILNIHYDEEIEETYIEEKESYDFDNIHYVYVNNNVQYLNSLTLE